MKAFSIYYLIDPTDERVRYVGYSCNPEKRYFAHIDQAFNCRTHKECWISSLLKRSLYPILSIRCIVDGADEAKRVEIALIAVLKGYGVDLTNGTRGGDGSAGFKWNAENYRKHEIYWSTIGCKKVSPLKGVKQSDSHVRATMAANTTELLTRRGASIKAGWAQRNGAPTKKKGAPSGRQPNLGKTWTVSDESKENYRKSWTPERRAAQSERMSKRRQECE